MLPMRLAEQYILQFGNLAKTTNTIIMPSNVADVAVSSPRLCLR